MQMADAALSPRWKLFVRRLSQALDRFPAIKGFARRVYREFSPSANDARAPIAIAPAPKAPQPLADVNSREYLSEAIARFRTRGFVGLQGAEANRREYGHAFQDVMLILSSDAFEELPLETQVETIGAIYNTVISSVLRESVTIADAITQHYPRLLRHPGMTEPLACRVYDCLYGLYFAGARSLSDMRAFDSGCVAPFEAWLKARLPDPVEPSLAVEPGHIAYFLHCAHFDKGNAVSPIIASLARAHAARPNRTVFLYAVQWVADDFVRAFKDVNVVVRTFAQDTRYDRLDEIAAQMRADRIAVAISDLNAAVGAALFTRRVAPLQMWTVMGYPYWTLSELDWVLLIGMDHQGGFGIRRDRFSYLRVCQEAETLAQDCEESALQEARSALPRGAFVFAVFSRLIKVSDQLLGAVARILEAEPRAHLLVVGTGDPRSIYEFLAGPALAGRVTFLNRNVDLNVYGRVIDAMLDTFPFHGGNACREVVVHGKPVLAVLSLDWERLLRDERDPLLLARDPGEFVAIALRLARDRAFRDERAAEAIRLTQRILDTAVMADEVETAIARAATLRTARC